LIAQTRLTDAWHHLSVLILLSAAGIVVLGIAHGLPAIDLAVSSLFCGRDGVAASCDGFPAASQPLLRMLRQSLFYVPPLCVIVLLLSLAWSGLFETAVDADRVRYRIAALVGYLAGPILLVNSLLKAHAGRPRPYESIPFGGGLPFVAAGDLSGACARNCSFISGEAAAAGWLLCLLPLVGGRHRRTFRIVIIAASIATPLLRLAMGGHYLSDVVLGWLAGAAALPAVMVGTALARRWGLSRLLRRPLIATGKSAKPHGRPQFL
jgi:membrane-associated phospholipid phosphatase